MAATLCPDPLGWKCRRTMGKGFVEKISLEPGVEVRRSSLMDGDNGDEGEDELTWVRSDESDKSVIIRQAKFLGKLKQGDA